MNKSLAQNVSVLLGRLAYSNPDFISRYLDFFLKQFCISLKFTKECPEKSQAFEYFYFYLIIFRGLCRAIIKNPNGVINHFAFLCDAICNYIDAPDELEELFHNLIFSFKTSLKDKWSEYFSLFPEKLRKKMTTRFAV